MAFKFQPNDMTMPFGANTEIHTYPTYHSNIGVWNIVVFDLSMSTFEWKFLGPNLLMTDKKSLLIPKFIWNLDLNINHPNNDDDEKKKKKKRLEAWHGQSYYIS